MNAMAAPAAAPSPPAPASSEISTTEVSWQTLFWIITTLALNTMTQPCGRVFRLPNYFSTYLRSSPLISILDMIDMVLLWLSISVSISTRRSVLNPRRVSLFASAKLTLISRFDDYPELQDQVNSATSHFGSTTWLRWLLFIMGPLPQAIRLASFKGVLWSKVLGFSFLVPWLLCELFIYLAARIDQSDLLEFDLREHRMRIRTGFAWIVACQTPMPFAIALVSNLGIPLMILVDRVISYVIDDLSLFWSVCLLNFASCFDVLFLLALHSGLMAFFSSNPVVAKSLLVSFPKIYATSLKDRPMAVFFFIMFMMNFALCFVGFCYWYDPTGTVNPGWTGVFG